MQVDDDSGAIMIKVQRATPVPSSHDLMQRLQEREPLLESSSIDCYRRTLFVTLAGGITFAINPPESGGKKNNDTSTSML